MGVTQIKVGNKVIAFAGAKASADPADGYSDANGRKINFDRKTVKVGGKTYPIYPWGTDNLLVNKKVALLRSSGGAQNLTEARVDFLFGGGFGFFKHVQKGGQTVKEPFTNPAIEEYLDAYGVDSMPDAVDAILTAMVETGNAFVNRSLVDDLPIYSLKDSLITRATISKKRFVENWLLCPDWSREEMLKHAVVVPAYQPGTDVDETIIQLRPYKSGQPYYGFAQYWDEESCDWIAVMTLIAKMLGSTVKHNRNLAHICRVASKYFDEMAAAGEDSAEPSDEPFDLEKEKNKVRDEFYKSVEEMLTDDDGPRIIYDECGFGVDGKIVPYIQFEEIKRSLNAKELNEAYQIAVLAFANSSRILPGLAGVSDGKMLGGSGSELKVSANYQQYFRTARERKLVEHMFNYDVKKALKLPADVFAGFKDILLVSDDKNPTGTEKKTTSQSTPKPQNDNADNNAN
ncbi:MAG: hypothetical protein U0X91_20680 [Spirosomataceae bacterium]